MSAPEMSKDELLRMVAELPGELGRAVAEAMARIKQLERDIALHDQTNKHLGPLCPCDPNPATTGGPEQECPLHGDGETFVAQVRHAFAVVHLAEQGARYIDPPPSAPYWPGAAPAIAERNPWE